MHILSTRHQQRLLIGGFLGLGLLNFITLVMLISGNTKPLLVQTTDGTAFTARTMSVYERSDETIKRFTADTLYLLFGWNAVAQTRTTQRNETGRLLDPGMDIRTRAGTAKVTQSIWAGSFALAPDFRRDILSMIADMIPPDLFQGETRVLFIIDHMSEPRPLPTLGTWEIDVLARQVIVRGDQQEQESIPFNKTIRLATSTAPSVPFGDSKLERAVYSLRQAALVITYMSDFEQQP